MTYEAMRDSGYSISQSISTAIDATLVDALPSIDESQSVDNAAWHAMAIGYEPKARASQRYRTWLNANIDTCTKMGLAFAIHAAEEPKIPQQADTLDFNRTTASLVGLMSSTTGFRPLVRIMMVSEPRET